MIPKKYITVVLVFVIAGISIVASFPKDKYYFHLPTTDEYPDNHTEVKDVKIAVSNRTREDVDAHLLTDDSVVPMFEQLLRKHDIAFEGRIDMTAVILKHVPTILRLKRKHNRARPWHVNTRIDKLYSSTAHTPAFPAGHAYQAWVLYRVLSEMYPSLEKDLYETAEYCDRVRVIAGLHYPSDGQYSKRLVMALDKAAL